MSLTSKFSLFVGILVVVILSGITLILIILRTQQLQQELTEKDKIESILVAQNLSNNFADYYFYQYDTYRDFVKKELTQYPDILHFSMYNTNGDLLFDTKQLADPPGTQARPSQKTSDPTILDAIIHKQQKVDIVTYATDKSIRIFVPYIDKFGVYRNMFEINFSMQQVQETIRQTIMFYSLSLGIFLVVSLAITILLVRQIIKPIQGLTKAATSFSQGNLDYEIPVTSQDELGMLSAAFNKMAKDLKLSRIKLEDQNQILEKEVAERTKELSKRLEEMEQLQKITIDRELKMIEMKKQLDEITNGRG